MRVAKRNASYFVTSAAAIAALEFLSSLLTFPFLPRRRHLHNEQRRHHQGVGLRDHRHVRAGGGGREAGNRAAERAEGGRQRVHQLAGEGHGRRVDHLVRAGRQRRHLAPRPQLQRVEREPAAAAQLPRGRDQRPRLLAARPPLRVHRRRRLHQGGHDFLFRARFYSASI